MQPYYEGDGVRLFHGDCLEVTEWLAADVLVTDPPYGIGWGSPRGWTNAYGGGQGSPGHAGIANDGNTATRDAALALWGAERAGVVFGALQEPGRPTGVRQTLIYAKSDDAGIRGAFGGFRRDAEAIYLTGRAWSVGVGGRSSILTSGARVAGPRGLSYVHGHPHTKPVDVLEQLISACPPGTVADPFAGSGSTLLAARNLGRPAIGVEIEKRYCELIAKRLSQGALFAGAGQ